MNSFEKMGEGVLLAQEGQEQLARELAAAVGRGVQRLRDWVAAMPTNLPPIEAPARKS